LVAAYSFGETTGTAVSDASDKNNAGMLGSTVTRSSQGHFGGSPVFSGDSFVTIPGSASLALANSMTLES